MTDGPGPGTPGGPVPCMARIIALVFIIAGVVGLKLAGGGH